MADPTERLLAVIREFGGDTLRDVWLFDQWAHQCLFVREDVAAFLDDIDVDGCIDNERYGYVTRDTYETLYYADYEYTVRGFSSFEQFRTFVTDGATRVGILASFDRPPEALDFGSLFDAIDDLRDEYPATEFMPPDDEG